MRSTVGESKYASLLQAIALVFFSIVFSLFVVECLLRLYVYDERGAIRLKDSQQHHRLASSVEATVTWGGREYPFFTNSLGLRDTKPRTVKRAFAGTRILLLGDSFTEGVGVKAEDSYPVVLESKLKEQGWPVQILNGGVSSYSPTLSLIQLKDLLAQGIQVDAVILALDQSDIQDSLTYSSWEKNGYNPLAVQFFNSFAVVRLFYDSWQQLFGVLNASRDQKRRYYSVREEWAYDKQLMETIGYPGTRIVEAKIEAMNEYLREKEISFFIFIYPWKHQLQRSTKLFDYEEWVTRLGESHNILVFNMFPYLSRSRAKI